MIVSEKGGGSFPQCPTGLQPARCFGLVDIGTHEDNFDGRTRTRRQVVLMFETPHAIIDDGGEHDGQPFQLSQFYTASLGEKAKLRADLIAWRGREFAPEELAAFDMKAVLGKSCTLNVVTKNNKSRIGTLLPAQKGVQLPPQVNKTVYFSLDEYKQAEFDALPEWLRKFVEKSPEYKAIKTGAPVRVVSPDDIDDGSDEVPF